MTLCKDKRRGQGAARRRAAAVLGWLVAAAAACGGDDDGGDDGADPSPDGGSAVDSGAAADSGSAEDAGAALPNATIVFVHASPDFPTVRFCFDLNGQSTPLGPQPEQPLPGQPYPGLVPGTGGAVPDTGVDPSAFAITPYAVVAEAIQPAVSGGVAEAQHCNEIIPGQVDPGEYVELAEIPRGTLARGASLIAALTGCLPAGADPEATPAACGVDYDPAVGNLALRAAPVDRVGSASAGETGFQAVHLSSQAETAQINGLYFAVVRADGDVVPIGGRAAFAGEGAGPVNLTEVVAAADAFAVFDGDPAAGGELVLAQPIAVAQANTVGPGQPDYVVPGKTYTIVLLGDPAVSPPPGEPAGTAGHFLVFPSDPS